MKKILLFLTLFIGYLTLESQTVLTIENQNIVNTDVEWDGYNVPHNVKTTLTFRNNSITSINTSMYLLQAGDDYEATTINNLDGASIYGNNLTWNGTQTGNIITHGLFVGYNINQTIKWNKLTNCPYNIIFKSGGTSKPNMNITAGGASYNIIKGGRFAGRCKGINGARFYNNTFYGDAGNWHLLLINANTDGAPTYPGNPSINTKVKNNIFYTTTKTPSINIDAGSRTGFECDYNLYWCEAGDNMPVFTVNGSSYTWTQWRALGYDQHSVVMNPNFNNTTDFVPATRLDYGTNIGTEFQTGLSTSATWVVGTTPTTQIQNGTWQVGARVYAPAVINDNITYYVSNSLGNDANNGTSINTPWKTINKVNSTSFKPGSTILFKCGDVWKEQLSPSTSGTSSNLITYGNYGTGNLPIITARDQLTGTWTSLGSNRYRYTITLANSGIVRTRVWVSGVEVKKCETSAVTSTKRFYGDASYLYLYSTTAPGTTVEISGYRGLSLSLYSKDYLVFKNIDFRGGGGANWSCVRISDCDYLTFDGCNLGRDAGCYGVNMSNSNYCEFKYNMFDTGDQFFDDWQAENSEDGLYLSDGCNNNLIHHNEFRNWGHTALGFTKDQTGTSLSNNKVYDNYFTAPNIDYCRAFGIHGHEGGITTGNEIYRNHVEYMPTRNQLSFPDLKFYNNIINNIFGTYVHGGGLSDGQGIGIQEYEGHRGIRMKIYNNTIVNCSHPGIQIIGWEAVDIEQNEFTNNIIANCDSQGNNYQIEGDNLAVVNNNIWRNNLLYSSATSNVVHYRGSTYTATGWNSADSNGDIIANNIGGNPNFVSSSNFHLQSSSPAIGTGYSPTLSSTDYDLVSWKTIPAIGAYEFVGTVVIVAPTVNTTAITNITTSTATSGGNVTSDGGSTVTAKGVCWSTNTNPTTALTTKTINGTGTGSFTSSITGLAANTTYHVRAYATNSAGTAYGSDLTFTTPPIIVLPTVTTGTTTATSSTTATSGGNVTSNGGGTVTDRGVCWSTSINPTITNNKISNGTGTGSFTSSITGLAANTTYHVRAYATNSAGTAYGGDITFTTPPIIVPPTVPTVNTTAITNITTSTATSGGNVTSDGGATVTARGVCWSTNINPTVALSTKTIDGTGTGSFTSNMSSLTPGTLYHVRAYATNSAGTVYGTDITFTTTSQIYNGPYYLSPSGNDITGNGSINQPWLTLNKAWSVVKAGDYVYMMGGTYQYNNEQVLNNKNGTSLNPIQILPYQTEKPIISPSTTFFTNGFNDGIVIQDCEYVYIKGLEITGYVQPKSNDWGNGIVALDVRHCIFENLNIHHGCFGFTMGNDDGITDNNLILNCDFHHNSDPITSFPAPYNNLFPYGNADGLTIRIDGTNGVGTTNYVIGCRMWYNSDDGIDLWENEGTIIIKDSWSFLNGYYFDTTTKGPGDGNGFKLGRTYNSSSSQILRKIYNCVAFMNSGWGFVRNGALCNMEIFNNTAYKNGSTSLSWSGGFFFGEDGDYTTPIPFYLKNNIAYQNIINATVTLATNSNHNSWDSPVTVSDADFVNLISSELTNPRQSDGNLPNINFLHLATGSDLIGKGIDVGIPHQGTYPDLGAFDYKETVLPYHQIIVSKGFNIKIGTNSITTDTQ